MKKYNHLNSIERELIFLYQAQDKSYREIARILGRDHKTISRELRRNSLNSSERRIIYSPSRAQALADKKRTLAKIGLRKLDNPVLRSFVIKRLGKGWSPEQIAGRLKLKVPNLYVSYETIYRFIYDKKDRRVSKLRLWELLRRRYPKRQSFKTRKSKRQKQIPGRLFIEGRSEEASLRRTAGHWETDNMEGPRESKTCVSVNVDRKTYLVNLDKLNSKKAKEKKDSLLAKFQRLPNGLIKTITFDNGSENYQHQKVARGLNCQTYFCHPYHSWEKGTVENTIGLVRQYLPKRTNLVKITKAELNWIAWQLNNRPRKKLGFYTPSEIFYKETGWVT